MKQTLKETRRTEAKKKDNDFIETLEVDNGGIDLTEECNDPCDFLDFSIEKKLRLVSIDYKWRQIYRN